MKPNFLIIGGQRCGTGWLSQCLREHPEIFMAKDETRFFDLNYENGIDWWEKQFFSKFKGEKAIGEKTANYMFDSQAAQRIYNTLPNTKLIAILRDPVERFSSNFLLKYPDVNLLQSKYFYRICENNKSMIQRGMYYEQLVRFLKYFQRDQLLVKIYEEKDKTPLGFIQEVFAFLNTDTNFIPDSLTKQTKLGRSQYTSKTKKIAGRVFLSKYSPVREIYRNFIQKTKQPNLDPEKKAWIRSFYEKEIIQLENLLDLELTSWKE